MLGHASSLEREVQLTSPVVGEASDLVLHCVLGNCVLLIDKGGRRDSEA